jgi:2-oxo-4-hydroxy-4-carboxy-5-ureidoimidazoline decarboxylase
MSAPASPTEPRLVPIEVLNALAEPAFAAALRPLFEAAAPLAAALYGARPFASYTQLIEQAERIAEHLPAAQQVEIVNAHPRIGERPDVVRQTSSLSYREQGYAGEDAAELAPVYAALAELNRAYEQRFGFRFVVFVNRRPKSAIVDVLRARLTNERQHELRTALGEMILIARDRLRTLHPTVG